VAGLRCSGGRRVLAAAQRTPRVCHPSAVSSSWSTHPTGPQLALAWARVAHCDYNTPQTDYSSSARHAWDNPGLLPTTEHHGHAAEAHAKQCHSGRVVAMHACNAMSVCMSKLQVACYTVLQTLLHSNSEVWRTESPAQRRAAANIRRLQQRSPACCCKAVKQPPKRQLQ